MFLTGGVVGVIVVPFMVIYLLAKQPQAAIESVEVKDTRGGSENKPAK